MNSLEDAKVVIAGGTGGVGEGIVRAFLKQKARVVATSRSETRLRELAAHCQDIPTGELIPLVADLSDEPPARDFQSRLYRIFKELDIAVAALGGWQQGNPLTSVDMSTWNQVLQDNLTSHFLALKMLVPLLHPKTGRYVHLNGFAAEQPFPQAGPVALAAAAQKSMMLTLAEELTPTGIRVIELILGPINTRQRERNGTARPDWYTADDVGEHVLRLVTSSSREVVHRLVGTN